MIPRPIHHDLVYPSGSHYDTTSPTTKPPVNCRAPTRVSYAAQSMKREHGLCCQWGAQAAAFVTVVWCLGLLASEATPVGSDMTLGACSGHCRGGLEAAIR
jgi:hypothetical protein